MTINGIWEWANQVSHTVPLDTLRNKILAIDGHIWLYESLKGCESHHQQTPNSYLITFFTRIQYLRELRITPIVVFDSIIPTSPALGEANQDEFVARKRRFGDSPFTNLEDHVYKADFLLSQMGIKVMIAPGDGEAQCAELERIGVTSGCITTDFDYFLFGGINLYRFDFSSSTTVAEEVKHLSIGQMMIERKLSRPQLVSTAILLGCDYFHRGVPNVGIATVFDILAEFGEEGNDEMDPNVILDRFVSYVREEIPARSEDSLRKLRLRRRKFSFDPSFPNCPAVHAACKTYMHPLVFSEISRNPSTLSSPPNLPKVEQILLKECGWTSERLQKEMNSSHRRSRNLTNTVSQTRIPEFFATTKSTKHFSPIVEPCVSMDEYISANNTWIRKRKQSDSPPEEKKKKKIQQKRKMHPVDFRRRGAGIGLLPATNPTTAPILVDVIDLDDSD